MSTGPVLVTGIDEPLGAATAERLTSAGRTVIAAPPAGGGYEPLAAVVRDQRPDAVVHCAMVQGDRDVDVDLVGTIALTAAVGQASSTVRVVVVASSAAFYPSSSRAPQLRREREQVTARPRTQARAVAEAERYVDALAGSAPHMSVATVRLGDLAGTPPLGPLARLLSAPVVPTIVGFDPAVQFLHLDDAARALEHVLARGLAGRYNAAGDGVVRWRRAITVAGKRAAPLPPWPDAVLAGGARIGLRVPSADTLAVLRFGRALDTGRLAASGFIPTRTSTDCARLLAMTT